MQRPAALGSDRCARVVSLAIVFAVAACSDSTAPTGSKNPPMVRTVSVSKPDSVKPAFVFNVATDADSARVGAIGPNGRWRVVTDFVAARNDTAHIVLAGLHPGEPYGVRVEAVGSGGSTLSDPMTVTADPLPPELQGATILTTAGVQPTLPYIMTELKVGTVKYESIFDSTGTLVWYRSVPGGSGMGDFQMQPTGAFSSYRGTSFGWQPVPGEFSEMALDGSVLRTWSAPGGSYTDPHEFRLRTDGGVTSAYFFVYRIAPMDMREHCASATEPTAAHMLVRSDGVTMDTVFDARSRFGPADWVSPPLCGLGDYDHPNALDFADDGTILVSWRNLGAVTSIDPVTRSVLWQFGGAKETLTLSGDPLNGIGGQHSVRASGHGRFMVYDNGTNHSPPRSRMVEYAVDQTAGTAQMTRNYLNPNGIYTMFQGSAAPLANGGAFIGWSTAATVTEVDPSGNRVWEGVVQIAGVSQQFYRALPLRSLYHFEAP